MKEIKLTQGKVALVDDEDYEYLMQWKWYAKFNPHTNSFYALRTDYSNGKQKTIWMHRIILNITDPKIQADHRKHDTLNNSKSNLRIATKAQNNANTTSHKNSTSKYLGVSWHKRDKKWYARICKDYKLKNIGCFTNETDAALAYNEKAIEIHGNFANLNIITPLNT